MFFEKLALELGLKFSNKFQEDAYRTIDSSCKIKLLRIYFLCTILALIPTTIFLNLSSQRSKEYIAIGFLVFGVILLLGIKFFGKYMSSILTLYMAGLVFGLTFKIARVENFDIFWGGYILASFCRLVGYNIIGVKMMIVYQLMTMCFKYSFVPHNRIDVILASITFDILTIVLNYEHERTNRIMYNEVYKYKNSSSNFCRLLDNYLPNQVIVLSKNLEYILYSNQKFQKTICSGTIEETIASFKNYTIEDENEEHNFVNLKKSSFDNDKSVSLLDLLKELSKNLDQLKTENVTSVPVTKNSLNKKSNETSICSTDTLNKSQIELNGTFKLTIFYFPWGNLEAIAVVFNDITHEKLVSELRISDKNKDLVIATVSHELRTPINAIMGMTDEAIKRVTDPLVLNYLNVCKNSSILMLNFVNSILDIGQIKENRFMLILKEFNIRTLVSNVKTLFDTTCKMKNVLLKVDIKENVPHSIVSDKNRLTQILINLLGNAFKFTFVGEITIRMEMDSQFPDPNGERLKISVIDTGIGINPEDTKRLFKMYGKLDRKSKQMNTEGIGLGLTISNTLAMQIDFVKKNGLQVESKEKEGTNFYFYVQSQLHENNSNPNSLGENSCNISEDKLAEFLSPPITTSLKKPPETNPSSDTIAKRWCLLVDDNVFNILVASNLMKSREFLVKTALTGEECIKIARDHTENLLSFDVILMDCQMPVMDGYETTRNLKNLMRSGEIYECPIIALTANTIDSKFEKLAKEAGMDSFLPKPLNAYDLDDTLKRIKTNPLLHQRKLNLKREPSI